MEVYSIVTFFKYLVVFRRFAMNIKTACKLGYDKVYFTFDCVGDTLLLISALRYLYEATKKKILIATNYKELTQNCEYIDVLDGFSEDTLTKANYQMLLNHGIAPIFISATNFVHSGNSYRPIWGARHILVNVCEKVGISGKIELAPKIFLSNEEKKRGRFFEKSQIAIVSSGNQPYKAIPFDLAQSVIHKLFGKYNFVQIGSMSDPPLDGAIDKREEGGIRGAASILYNSDLFIGGIGGLMHVARAADCRSIIAFSAAEPTYLENYVCNVNVFAPDPKCNLCGINERFPYLINCQNNYSCIKGIDVNEIVSAVSVQMSKLNHPLEVEVVSITANSAKGLEDYIKRFGKIPEV